MSIPLVDRLIVGLGFLAHPVDLLLRLVALGRQLLDLRVALSQRGCLRVRNRLRISWVC
jgi:hypothetical protein